MSTLTLPVPGLARSGQPVRIAVLVTEDHRAEAIKVAGPVRSAVKAAFAHPRLTGALQALQMDPDRLIGRIESRWHDGAASPDQPQTWEKSDGSTTVRWWVERDIPRTPA